VAETIAIEVDAEKTVSSIKVMDQKYTASIEADENHVDALTVPNAAADLMVDLFPSGNVATGLLLILYTDQVLQVKLDLNTNPVINVNSLLVVTGDHVIIYITVPGSVDANVQIVAAGSAT
jgi:hypothetical protein